MTHKTRTLLLIVDGIGLVGVVAFSALSALHPGTQLYVIGQVVSVVLVLGSVLLLRRLSNNTQQQ
jgi:hypothetical protein